MKTCTECGLRWDAIDLAKPWEAHMGLPVTGLDLTPGMAFYTTLAPLYDENDNNDQEKTLLVIARRARATPAHIKNYEIYKFVFNYRPFSRSSTIFYNTFECGLPEKGGFLREMPETHFEELAKVLYRGLGVPHIPDLTRGILPVRVAPVVATVTS